MRASGWRGIGTGYDIQSIVIFAIPQFVPASLYTPIDIRAIVGSLKVPEKLRALGHQRHLSCKGVRITTQVVVSVVRKEKHAGKTCSHCREKASQKVGNRRNNDNSILPNNRGIILDSCLRSPVLQSTEVSHRLHTLHQRRGRAGGEGEVLQWH